MEKDIDKNKLSLYYACCPFCKTVLVQALNISSINLKTKRNRNCCFFLVASLSIFLKATATCRFKHLRKENILRR